MSAAPGPDEWRAAGRSVNVLRRRLFVVDSAPGSAGAPTILLIHGFPTSSWDWHAVWPALAANYRLVAPDLLGFGYSEKPARHNYSINEQADLIDALVAELQLGPLQVLAHDYGDTVAQELLARDNARGSERQWRNLCLLNGGLFPESHRPRFAQTLLHGPLGGLLTRLMGRATLARNLRAISGPNTQPDDETIDIFWDLIREDGGNVQMHRLIRYMREREVHRERWVGALKEADIPIQLINGAADPISGAHMVDRYRELISNDNIVSLPKIGHYPQVEAPGEVAKQYLRFLTQCRAAA